MGQAARILQTFTRLCPAWNEQPRQTVTGKLLESCTRIAQGRFHF